MINSLTSQYRLVGNIENNKKAYLPFGRALTQSCKSGGVFWVGFGPQVDQNFGLNSGLRRAFSLRSREI